MKFLNNILAITLLSYFYISSTLAVTTEADGVFHLTYGNSLSPNHTFSQADKDWINYVEQESNGRIRITPFWSATLISSDENVHELRHGVTDIAMITPIYMRSGMQAIKAQTGFYIGADKPETQIEVFHCLMRDFPIFNQELEGIQVLAVQGGTPSYILTKDRAIRTIDDLAGLRLRAPTALIQVLYELGGDAVLMPMGDVYPAFSKGIIDGVLTPEDTLFSMHFAEIGQYFNMLPMHRGGYPSRAISNRSWEQLPEDLQELLLESGRYWEQRITHYLIEGNQKGVDYGHELGVEFIEVNQHEQDRYNEVYNELALDAALRLSEYDIDGEVILDYVLELINNMNAGEHAGCR